MTEILLGDAKVDKFRRTSVIKVVFDKLELPENGGRIQFFYSDGEITIRKATSDPVRIYTDEQKIEIMEKDDIFKELMEKDRKVREDEYMTTDKFKMMLEKGEDVSAWEDFFYPWYRKSEKRFIKYNEMTLTEKECVDSEYELGVESSKHKDTYFDETLKKVNEEYERRKNKK